MAESQQKTVVLQGLDAGMFGDILSYIYSGTLHVSLNKVQLLYQAADLLQLDYVKDTCSSYMAMNVECSTCVALYKFADVYSLDIVRKACLQLIDINFVEVASSEEFCSLSVNQLTEIISHDELDVKDETTVWEAAVRWVHNCRVDRQHHLPSILPHIRFNLLTPDDTAAISEHPMVKEDPGSSEVIRNGVLRGASNMKPRFGIGAEKMVLFFETSPNPNRMQGINPRIGQSFSIHFTEIPPIVSATVTSDNEIYVLAKESEDQMSLLLYKQMKSVWEQMSVVEKLPGLIRNQHLLALDGHLYYLACDWTKPSHIVRYSMKRYHKNTNSEWQDCSQLKDDISDMEPSLSNGCLYLLCSRELYCYNPTEDRWFQRAPPTKSTHVFWTNITLGTEIFRTDMNFTSVSVYDTEADRWQELPAWKSPLEAEDRDYNANFFVFENQLHVYLDAAKCKYRQVLVYDRHEGVWRESEYTLPDVYWDCSPVAARVYLPGVQDRCANTQRTIDAGDTAV
ncbi:kelch repeat and BTB domain-containing protein 2-like [Branchiostoma floridae]|uniref:Kelch repeat and BTB domain-containing protein 2-like n=1 Tax=Branchiostoma floridae TaxID=7739 RepID=A0A9J7N3T5_BRAFL|nr:kelch repeat and BTB domain-containing protein 2-like [Branchiostoma floridae]